MGVTESSSLLAKEGNGNDASDEETTPQPDSSERSGSSSGSNNCRKIVSLVALLVILSLSCYLLFVANNSLSSSSLSASFMKKVSTMTNEAIFINVFSTVLLAVMFLSFFRLLANVAPYGRYANEKGGSGFKVNARVAWSVQEAPSFFIPLICFFVGPSAIAHQKSNMALLSFFLFHYFNRTVIYPLRISGGSKANPLSMVVAAFAFTSINGYLIGRYLTSIHGYDDDYLSSIPFLAGTIIFWLGLLINWHSDYILRNLRKPGETGYKIPTGGMYDYVTSANYFGEILEWVGFAIATGFAIPAVVFAINTFFNLVPRAITHHQWYHEKFDEYKHLNRKVIIPFIY